MWPMHSNIAENTDSMQFLYVAQLLYFGHTSYSAQWTEREHKLRVFTNKVLSRILGPKRKKVKGGWEKRKMSSYIISTVQHLSLGLSDHSRRWDGWDMQHTGAIWSAFRISVQNMKGRDRLGDLSTDRRVISKTLFKKDM